MENEKTKAEINSIFSNKIEVKNIDYLCENDQIPKGNKTYNLECSVLFVDVRQSTFINDEIGKKNMLKIYKSLTRIVVNCAEEYSGEVKQIVGDGFMCLFIKSSQNNQIVNSGKLAVDCSIGVNTLIDQVLNPKIKESGINQKISVGCGINTGHILLAKVGRRGKNKVQSPIFPGNATNYASKFCHHAGGSEIIFDEKTYLHVKDFYSSIKRTKLFDQYIYSISSEKWEGK